MLYPANPALKISNRESFLQRLQNLGLAGEPFAPECYLAGSKFLRLINFLGCSPTIGFSPEEGGQFCYLKLALPLGSPTLLYGSNCKAPRCRICGRIAAELPPPGRALLTCSHCSTEQAVWELNWRRSACVTCNPLAVYGIFESEAIPSSKLLQELARITGTAWDYCYIRDQLGISS